MNQTGSGDPLSIPCPKWELVQQAPDAPELLLIRIFLPISARTSDVLHDAQFELCDDEFVFSYGSHALLHLRFNHAFNEGAGEHAIYHQETGVLLVLLPKVEIPQGGVEENRYPPYSAQSIRAHTSRRGKKPKSSNVSVTEAEDRSESVLPDTPSVRSAMLSKPASHPYGFANRFSGLLCVDASSGFAPSTPRLRFPDSTSNRERIDRAGQEERASFSMVHFIMDNSGGSDEDGSRAALAQMHAYQPYYDQVIRHDWCQMRQPSERATGTQPPRYTPPWYVTSWEETSLDSSDDLSHTLNRSGNSAPGQPSIVLWRGNTTVCRTDPPDGEVQVDRSSSAESSSQLIAASVSYHDEKPCQRRRCAEGASKVQEVAHQAGRRLQPPPFVGSGFDDTVQWTPIEQRILTVVLPRSVAFLMRHSPDSGSWGGRSQVPSPSTGVREWDAFFKAGELSTPLSPERSTIWWCLIDLLLVYCYEVITTLGEGNAESAWTVQTLSGSLSMLLQYNSAHEVLYRFARRVLSFPLYRPWWLVERCVRDVVTLLLLGPRHVVRCLVSLHCCFSQVDAESGACAGASSPTRVLNDLFIDPYIVFLSGLIQREGRSGSACEGADVSISLSSKAFNEYITGSPGSNQGKCFNEVEESLYAEALEIAQQVHDSWASIDVEGLGLD